MQNLRKVQNCASEIKRQLPQGFAPVFGIILGTGLSQLADSLTSTARIPFDLLPDFPPSTVRSHQGAFVAGNLSGVPVLLQQGRCHLYEGRSPEEVCMGVRVMAGLGIKALIVTNAAGAINPLYSAGTLMAIEDHINFSGQSPLTGPNEDAWGPRFPDMSRVYDANLLGILEEKSLSLGIRLEKGVYFCIPGPQLETRAETRAYRALGGDAVGMSTVLEVIAARHMGLRVAGISCLSNKNLPDCMAEHTIEDIIRLSEKAGKHLERLLLASLPDLAAACNVVRF